MMGMKHLTQATPSKKIASAAVGAMLALSVVGIAGCSSSQSQSAEEIGKSMNEAVEGATGLNGGSSSSSNEQKSTAPKTETETTTATKSQQNALKMAKTYLSSMPFSYSGLIDQLEYEGFSLEDATYGADNCGADWMVQAEKSAKNYLDMMAFSHSGLVEQLMYEGYTAEEAEHGATSQGI